MTDNEFDKLVDDISNALNRPGDGEPLPRSDRDSIFKRLGALREDYKDARKRADFTCGVCGYGYRSG